MIAEYHWHYYNIGIIFCFYKFISYSYIVERPRIHQAAVAAAAVVVLQ